MSLEVAPQAYAPKLGIEEIRRQVKLAIAKVSGRDVSTIPDDASFQGDLDLDSLSIIELVVEVQYRFKIPDLPDDRSLSELQSVEQTVDMVCQQLLLT